MFSSTVLVLAVKGSIYTCNRDLIARSVTILEVYFAERFGTSDMRYESLHSTSCPARRGRDEVRAVFFGRKSSLHSYGMFFRRRRTRGGRDILRSVLRLFHVSTFCSSCRCVISLH